MTLGSSSFKEAVRSLVAKAKASGCLDCGTKERLTFDHLPGHVKRFSPDSPRGRARPPSS
jgi:hypothetical protein